ncbi:MAG TPA: replication protein RepA [Methanomicrobia archaeon]|nr:MAG: replication protein RepA [Thermococci archaeon]HDN81507.1 replication protein RepA [Methanomicrobia archaeon]HHF09698.1 replication protein RepA [Methanomicrobia archaeon]
MRYYGVEKDIVEIKEDDKRVSIVGTVVRKNTTKYSMIVDDGTGEIEVYTDTLFDIGNLVRVIGRIFKDDTSRLSINAEIVQDFSGFDVALYQKVRIMEGKL